MAEKLDVPDGPASSGTRERRHQRTREELLRIAEELILEAGVEAFSLREVARRADYAPSALYKYFQDKDDLIGALADESLGVLGSYMEAVPADLPPVERVCALAEAYLECAKEHPGHFSLVFGRLVTGTSEWDVYVAHAWPFTILVDACRAGVELGEFAERPGFRAEEMALGCWCLVHGAVRLFNVHLSSIEVDLQPAILTAMRVYTEGLRDPSIAIEG